MNSAGYIGPYGEAAPYRGDPLEQLFQELLRTPCSLPANLPMGIGSPEQLFRLNLKLRDELKTLKGRIQELADTITQMGKPTPLQGYKAGPQ